MYTIIRFIGNLNASIDNTKFKFIHVIILTKIVNKKKKNSMHNFVTISIYIVI